MKKSQLPFGSRSPQTQFLFQPLVQPSLQLVVPRPGDIPMQKHSLLHGLSCPPFHTPYLLCATAHIYTGIPLVKKWGLGTRFTPMCYVLMVVIFHPLL